MPLRNDHPTRPRILVILHQEHSTAGRVGHLLRLLGYSLDVRRPRFGDPLPETLADHGGAIVFGGPMSANDPDPYIAAEIDWLDIPLRENAPLLGICLGAQMMALKLGQPIIAHPGQRVEIGYYPICPTEAADTLSDEPFPRWVYHWHNEGFRLPGGAALLATGDHFECQAFRYGQNAFGLQFHPEVTYAMICRWTVRGAHHLGSPDAMPAYRQREAWFQHDAAVARWTRAFLPGWAAGSIPAASQGKEASPPHLAA